MFAALKLEKLAMFVTVCLIVLVAAFNIVTTLIMMVMEKNKDIAILSAMGVQRADDREGIHVGRDYSRDWRNAFWDA